MTQLVLSETRDTVRILTLNRPEKRNALNSAMHDGLLAALAAADADTGVRCVLLAGAGKSFCAGADLAEHHASELLSEDQKKARIEQMGKLQIALPGLGKPVVAAVQGTVLGAGAGLAISADIVVMTEDARIGYPEVPHGMVPTLMFPTLMRQIGRRAAFELLFLGDLVEAKRALALGLANAVVPTGDLMLHSLALADRFAAIDPRTLRQAKTLFYDMADLPLREGMMAGVAATVAHSS